MYKCTMNRHVSIILKEASRDSGDVSNSFIVTKNGSGTPSPLSNYNSRSADGSIASENVYSRASSTATAKNKHARREEEYGFASFFEEKRLHVPSSSSSSTMTSTRNGNAKENPFTKAAAVAAVRSQPPSAKTTPQTPKPKEATATKKPAKKRSGYEQQHARDSDLALKQAMEERSKRSWARYVDSAYRLRLTVMLDESNVIPATYKMVFQNCIQVLGSFWEAEGKSAVDNMVCRTLTRLSLMETPYGCELARTESINVQSSKSKKANDDKKQRPTVDDDLFSVVEKQERLNPKLLFANLWVLVKMSNRTWKGEWCRIVFSQHESVLHVLASIGMIGFHDTAKKLTRTSASAKKRKQPEPDNNGDTDNDEYVQEQDMDEVKDAADATPTSTQKKLIVLNKFLTVRVKDKYFFSIEIEVINDHVHMYMIDMPSLRILKVDLVNGVVHRMTGETYLECLFEHMCAYKTNNCVFQWWASTKTLQKRGDVTKSIQECVQNASETVVLEGVAHDKSELPLMFTSCLLTSDKYI